MTIMKAENVVMQNGINTRDSHSICVVCIAAITLMCTSTTVITVGEKMSCISVMHAAMHWCLALLLLYGRIF